MRRLYALSLSHISFFVNPLAPLFYVSLFFESKEYLFRTGDRLLMNKRKRDVIAGPSSTLANNKNNRIRLKADRHPKIQLNPLPKTPRPDSKCLTNGPLYDMWTRVWNGISPQERFNSACYICDRTGVHFEPSGARHIIVGLYQRVLTLWPDYLSEPDVFFYPSLREIPVLRRRRLAMRSPTVPTIEPYKLFEMILRASRSGFSTAVLAVMILSSLANMSPPLRLSRWNIHRVTLGVTILAYKFDVDCVPLNAAIAEHIGPHLSLGIRDFNEIEVQTLFMIGWNVCYADSDRFDFFSRLRLRPPSL
jgi:hypothetical protein